LDALDGAFLPSCIIVGAWGAGAKERLFAAFALVSVDGLMGGPALSAVGGLLGVD